MQVQLQVPPVTPPVALARQPIRRLRTMEVVGHEVLLRSPALLGERLEREIGHLEAEPWFSVVTLEVLAQALDDAGGELGLDLHVNVSALDLRAPTLAASVGDALRRAVFPAGRLVLEVTEHHPVLDAPVVHENLHELRTLGVRVAVDDFGTGWANFRSLQVLRPEITKVGIEVVRAQPHLVSSLVPAVARTGGLVYVEGDVTPPELDDLAHRGVAAVQGHRFGRPRPIGTVDPGG